jgi:hypothetical protein
MNREFRRNRVEPRSIHLAEDDALRVADAKRDHVDGMALNVKRPPLDLLWLPHRRAEGELAPGSGQQPQRLHTGIRVDVE